MAVAPERLVLIGELANDERVDRLGADYFADFTDDDWERHQIEHDNEPLLFAATAPTPRNCTPLSSNGTGTRASSP